MKICSTENIKLIGSIEDSIKNNLASEIINRISTDVKKINAEIYLSYPIYINNSTGEKTSVDLTIVCNYGLYMIDIEENKLSDYTVLQDNIYNKAMAKFFKDNSLFKHRKLMFDFNLCTYSLKKCKEVDGYDIVFSVDEFIAYFKKTLSSNPYDCVLLNKMIAAVQESYGINNWTERDGTIEGSKAYLINKMSKNIEKYDSSQMNAILAECDGVQRIRGMAGSGKTVILARKAAELHSKHPDWDIVVTHFTRSLHDQLIDLIDKFYREKNEGASYNDRKLRVMHAWGSHSYNGVYYEISKTHDIHPFTFSEAKERFINNDVLFSKSCLETLRQVDNFKKLYDCILIDEAQDFDKNFMQLCYNVLGKEHRLIYAYDELQKLDREEMPDAITLFGEDIKLDTPLKVCYRNQSRTIVTAHALGMGLYRHEGLVQLPENANV